MPIPAYRGDNFEIEDWSASRPTFRGGGGGGGAILFYAADAIL